MVPKLIHGILGLLIGCMIAALLVGSPSLGPVVIMVLIVAVLIGLKLVSGGELAAAALIGGIIGAILVVLGVLSPASVADGNGWMFVALIVLALAL